MPAPPVLYAHAYGSDDAALKAQRAVLADQLRAWIATRGVATEIHVVLGMEDWRQHSKMEGGWKGWPEAAGLRYAMIVVPNGADPVGNGVARIVASAWRANRKILALRGVPEAGMPLDYRVVVGVDPDAERGVDRYLHLAQPFN